MSDTSNEPAGLSETRRAALESFSRAVNPARLEALLATGCAPVFTAASGSTLVDSEGREYTDFVCGFGAATLGHRSPAIMEALRALCDGKAPFTSAVGIPDRAGALAERLCGAAGAGLAKAYFCSTGAEAIETAMKFASARTGRGRFVSVTGGFHGLTTGALSLAGEDYWRGPFAALRRADVDRIAFADLQGLERLIRTERHAALVLEVVQGMGGVRRWSASDLAAAAHICARHGTLLILDEVLTGVGRTGDWFAFQGLEPSIRPDVLVCSKGISGGVVPAAAVLMQDHVYRAVYKDMMHANVHSNTFESNLMAMTIGLAVLDVIERDDLHARVSEMGRYLADGLARLRERATGIEEVRQHGLLVAFKVRGLDAPDDPYGGVLCSQLLMKRGFITCVANHDPRFVKLTPAFVVERREVDALLAELDGVLEELAGERGGFEDSVGG